MNNKVLSKAISDIAFVSGHLAAISIAASMGAMGVDHTAVVIEAQMDEMSTVLDEAVTDLITLTDPAGLSPKTLEQMAALVKKFKERELIEKFQGQDRTHLQADRGLDFTGSAA